MEKKDQKIRARVNPPPHFRAMPELKRLFSIDVFPYFDRCCALFRICPLLKPPSKATYHLTFVLDCYFKYLVTLQPLSFLSVCSKID